MTARSKGLKYERIAAAVGGDQEVREFIIAGLRTAIRHYDLHDEQKDRIFLLKQAGSLQGENRPALLIGSASWRETIAGLLCSLLWMMMLPGILGLFQILAEVKFSIENG